MNIFLVIIPPNNTIWKWKHSPPDPESACPSGWKAQVKAFIISLGGQGIVSTIDPIDLSNTSQSLESPCQQTQPTGVDVVLIFINTKFARDLGTTFCDTAQALSL